MGVSTKRSRNHSCIELSLVSALRGAATPLVLRGILQRMGFKDTEIIEKDDRLRHRVCVYLTPAQARRMVKTGPLPAGLKHVRMKFKVLNKEDWFDKWKVDFKPFALTDRIAVVPHWLRADHTMTKPHVIFIKSLNAFGTGLHETTRFMAGLIERCRGRFRHFLDVGTGSGILCVVAAVHGAVRIDAVDIDQDAVRSATENMAVNGFTLNRTVCADIKQWSGGHRYDFVAANLITHDLINFKKKIICFVKRGGFLAVSGVSNENADLFRAAYKGLPLRCLKIERGRDWSAFLFRRI